MDYGIAARAYVRDARALFAIQVAAPATERGLGQPADDMLARALTMLGSSATLNGACAGKMTMGGIDLRAEAEMQMLAKALTDLEAGRWVWSADKSAADGAERAVLMGPDPAHLDMIVGGVKGLELARGVAVITSLADGRARLVADADDVLSLVHDRVAAAGQTGMTAILGLGVANLLGGAGSVLMEAATLLGKGEQAATLADAASQFFARAYDGILSLLGRHLVNLGVEQALNWLNKVKDSRDKLFGGLLDQIYATRAISAEVARAVQESSVDDLARYAGGISALDTLRQGFAMRSDLAAKALTAMKWVNMIPLFKTPEGLVAQAAAYLALIAFMVWSGADYIDAGKPGESLLNRVAGVRTVVRASVS